MDNEQNKAGLTKEQKTGVVLLLVFALIVVGLGFLQMRNTIYGPFVLRLPDTTADYKMAFSDENTRLQMIDTDHDGLTDYDELNSYETSPYLPDTDSDGIDDKLEIEKGTNPNCAEGQTCSAAEAMATSTSELKESILPDGSLSTAAVISDSLGQLTTTETGEGAVVDEKAAAEALLKDPARLRELVRQSGALSEEQLAKIDDATLVKVFSETMKTVPTNSSNTNVLPGNTNVNTANTAVISSTTKK